ncbi:MAG TPA: CaiB/BaiF CoA-transferase family protein [Chloroflexota bacterium]|jgi:crotonobetainyl-CoA:carnitine CoA-transferase CaiB-like acyl-CoA transferase
MKALEGIRVLDLTHALAGPFCTYHLQLLGAEVIKVERPGLGDDFREFARLPGWEVSPSFIAVNAGKRSVTVNLKDPDGRAIVRELAARSDVVVENLRPGAAHELQLSWEDLRAVNPRLVYCSISGFGQFGAMAAWPAYDHTVQAIAGMSWSGAEDDVPTQGRAFSVDCFTGYVAFAQILGALLRRERSGEGQYLDVAMLDASLVLLAVGSVRQLITGDAIAAAQPIVHDRPTVAAYRTRDGWLWLSANFPHQFEALCRVIHAEDLLADPRFADAQSRTANSAALRDELGQRLAGCSAADLELQLMQAGCPAAKVRTTREVLQMPILRERDMLEPASVPGRQEPVTLVNAGFVANQDGPGLQAGVPALGADTDGVLRDLGYADADIARLRERSVV